MVIGKRERKKKGRYFDSARVSGFFFQVLWFPPPIKMTVTI
jgi:hypothetical protein